MFSYRLLLIALFAASLQANASVLTGDSSGFLPGDTLPDGNNILEWGTPQIFLGDKSSLQFSAVQFTANNNTPFVVSIVHYKNTSISKSTSFNNVIQDKSLDLTLNFTNPAVIGDYIFNYDISVTETDNTANDSDDI